LAFLKPATPVVKPATPVVKPATPALYKCPNGDYSTTGMLGCLFKCPGGLLSPTGETGCPNYTKCPNGNISLTGYEACLYKCPEEGEYSNTGVSGCHSNTLIPASGPFSPGKLNIPELTDVIAVCQSKGICKGTTPLEQSGDYDASKLTDSDLTTAFKFCKKMGFNICKPAQSTVLLLMI